MYRTNKRLVTCENYYSTCTIKVQLPFCYGSISNDQVNQGGLNLNGSHQLLVQGDDVNLVGKKRKFYKENTDALLVSIEAAGLERECPDRRASGVAIQEATETRAMQS